MVGMVHSTSAVSTFSHVSLMIWLVLVDVIVNPYLELVVVYYPPSTAEFLLEVVDSGRCVG